MPEQPFLKALAGIVKSWAPELITEVRDAIQGEDGHVQLAEIRATLDAELQERARA